MAVKGKSLYTLYVKFVKINLHLINFEFEIK